MCCTYPAASCVQSLATTPQVAWNCLLRTERHLLAAFDLHDIALFIDTGQAGSVDGQGTAFLSLRDHPYSLKEGISGLAMCVKIIFYIFRSQNPGWICKNDHNFFSLGFRQSRPLIQWTLMSKWLEKNTNKKYSRPCQVQPKFWWLDPWLYSIVKQSTYMCNLVH